MKITLDIQLKRRLDPIDELLNMMEHSDMAQPILAGPAPPIE